jgi:hypothetical protein
VGAVRQMMLEGLRSFVQVHHNLCRMGHSRSVAEEVDILAGEHKHCWQVHRGLERLLELVEYSCWRLGGRV